MNDFRIPLGDLAKEALDFVTDNLGFIFSALRDFFLGIYEGVEWVLITPPFWVIIVIAVVLVLVAFTFHHHYHFQSFLKWVVTSEYLIF